MYICTLKAIIMEVHAINKQGREAIFTRRVWDLLGKNKNGWIEYESRGEVLIPDKIIEFQQKRKEAEIVPESPVIVDEPIAVVPERKPIPKNVVKRKYTKK